MTIIASKKEKCREGSVTAAIPQPQLDGLENDFKDAPYINASV